MLQATTLERLAEIDLGTIPNAMPKVAGGFVFVEVANKDVRVFKTEGGLPQTASFPLDGHALAGDPLLLSDLSYLIARTDGKLIRLNPDNGTKAIYLHQGKLEQFEGMTPEQSQDLVGELMQEVVKPEYIYRHKWRKGDFMIWDDRASMHQAYSDYDLNETRTLHRIIAEPHRPA